MFLLRFYEKQWNAFFFLEDFINPAFLLGGTTFSPILKQGDQNPYHKYLL